MPESVWRTIDCVASLPARAVHIWRIPLHLEPAWYERYSRLVLAEELRRAERFIMYHHQLRFLAGRARLRCLLAAYLHTRPGHVSILYENLGKPYLDPHVHGDQIHFNFSNSQDWALLAVSDHCKSIGVDLEQIRPNRDLRGLAARYFHPRESAAIGQEPASGQVESFYRCWTRKEAFLKATGKGLTFPLRDVIVTSRAEEAPMIVSIRGETSRAKDWCLAHLDPTPGFVGALVHEAPSLPVILCAWSERHSGW